MTDTAGAQLLVEGPQDVWLTLDPQMSFFRSSYKRHVSFAMSLERVRVDPGGLVRFDMSKGDLLGYVYITAHDLTTDALIPTPITFTSMSTRIGEQIIDKRDLMYMNTIRPLFEAKNENQRKVPVGFQPLWLPFTGAYFPIVAIRYTQLDLLIEGLSPDYAYKVWCEAIHLPYEERRWFEMTHHHLMIQQVRKTVPLAGELCLSGPVKYIAWPTENYILSTIIQTRPVLTRPYPVPVIIDTTSANTFFVAQTSPYYNLVTLIYTTGTLPAGMSIVATAESGITLGFAQGADNAMQDIDVTATSPYGLRSILSFRCTASPTITRYLLENYQDQGYLVNGGINPTYFVLRGSTIVFYINAPGEPFNIQTVSGAYSSGNLYTDGISYPATDVGTIVWRISQSAPGTLYYASSNNPLFVGEINVIN